MLALGSLPLLNVLAKRFSTRLHPAVIGRAAASRPSSPRWSRRRCRACAWSRASAPSRCSPGSCASPRRDLYDVSLLTARIRGRFVPLLDLLPNIGLVLVLAYGGHLVIDGQLEPR